MPKLKNDRWERFAQGLASGKTSDKAHTDAGYRPNRKNAARLKANQDIQARVAEIQQRAANRAECTLADHLEKMAEIRDAALADKVYAAATTAEHHRGKASGLYIERVAVGNPGDFETLTDGQLDEQEAELDRDIARAQDPAAADQAGEAAPTRH